jgi:Flp pilus assembly pilin Flp
VKNPLGTQGYQGDSEMKTLFETLAALLADETGTVGLEYGATAGAAAGGVSGAVGQISDSVAGAADAVASVIAGTE